MPRDQADDGVVAYSSADIDGVESKLIVVSGHSCKNKPRTIDQVRASFSSRSGSSTSEGPTQNAAQQPDGPSPRAGGRRAPGGHDPPEQFAHFIFTTSSGIQLWS